MSEKNVSVKLSANVDAYKRAMGDAKSSTAEVGDAVDGVGKDLGELEPAAGKAGSGMGASLKGAFAAAGVGAAIGMAVKVGLDGFFARENVTKTLIGQFGQTAEEAERYGKMAGDLYAGNWGDSMDEVARAIGAVDQRMVDTGIVAEGAVEGITEKAMALSDTFGEDVSATVRSVSQLMLNGLAPDAETAMDIVTVGLQNGANAAGDLFDSIDEYSQHFSGFGLSAEDMMAMFSDGMANGQRDTDKLADAVKEMRIRVVDDSASTREAFSLIGLSSDEMAAKISEGGDSARDAFIEILKRIQVIEDPIDRNTVGVGLLGTMFEDLGPLGVDSLLAIEDGLGNVEGAAQGVVDSFATTETGLQTLKRQGEQALGAVGNAAGRMVQSALGMPDVLDRMDDSLRVLGDTAPKTFDDAVAAVTPYVTSIEEAEFMVGIYRESVDGLTTSLEKQHPRVQDLIDAQTEEWKSARDAERATADLADEVNSLGGEAGTTADEIAELEREYDILRGNLSDTSMYMDVEDAFADLKESGMDALAAIEGDTEDANEKMRDHQRELIDAKNKVIDYAEEVGEIPPETVTEILTLIDEGNFAEAERRLAGFERARTSTLTVTLRQEGQIRTPSGNWGALADGGPARAGHLYEVGEGNVAEMFVSGGRQFMIPGNDGQVLSGAQLAAAAPASLSSSSAAPSAQVDPESWGRQAADAISRRLQHNQRAA